jgi:hypothetical protein
MRRSSPKNEETPQTWRVRLGKLIFDLVVSVWATRYQPTDRSMIWKLLVLGLLLAVATLGVSFRWRCQGSEKLRTGQNTSASGRSRFLSVSTARIGIWRRSGAIHGTLLNLIPTGAYYPA